MRGLNNSLPKRALPGFIALFIVYILSACNDKPENKPDSISEGNNNQVESEISAEEEPNLVEVTTLHNLDANEHSFEVSKDEVPSGWTTFRLNNGTKFDHFYLLYKVPQAAIDSAKSANHSVLDHWHQTITVPFQQEWNHYINGEVDFEPFVENLFGAVLNSAPWFVDAAVMGGPGITSAGQSSETTVHLPAGTYIAECYVKDNDQEFHSYNGMIDEITVTDESSGVSEPSLTFDITVSQKGIEHVESVRPGMHTVGINFGTQPENGYEHLLGHNVQLVRLEDGYDQALLDELGDWMDWTTQKGLVDRAPSGATFLGGSMEMSGDNTAYFHINLTPGSYAWITEVPEPAAKNMLKTFSVAAEKEEL